MEGSERLVRDMNSRRVASLALALTVASADTSPLNGEKTWEVIWKDETHSRVTFVPGTLLRSLGSWEGDEMPDLSGIGLLEQEAEALRLNVQEARGRGRISIEDSIAGLCPDGSSHDSTPLAPDGTTSSKPLSEWLRLLGGRAYVARIEYLEAGWVPVGSSVGTLVGFRVESWVAGVEPGAPLKEMRFLKGFGWLQLGSATLCRGSRSVLSRASPGDQFFIWDKGGEPSGPLAGARMILPVSGDAIDTTSCNFCAGEPSESLASIRKPMERP